MSKRAEEKSIVYQLATHGPRVMGGAAILSEDDYKFWNINYDFKAGYEEAEKDLGWISVKDRLPEDDGWYLTCVRMEHLGNTPQIVCSLFFWKKYKRWEDADGLYNGKIDYWMPIPALPKEEEK